MACSMAFDPITDYSRTQRIVLLVDLNPLLHLHNPTHYITSIISSAKILLDFSPFSSSTLFAFKLFFSSLSPLLSSSRLHRLIPNCPLSLSFDHPAATFNSISSVLNSLLNLHQYPLCESSDSILPLASCFAAAMGQLLHDYAWDPVMEDSDSGTFSERRDWFGVRSNLVVLFSPLSESVQCLSELWGVALNDECPENVDISNKKIRGNFGSVNDAFIQRDIKFSWMDVRYEISDDKIKDNDIELKLGVFESGIKNLGWAVCSTDSIVLGSALFPFGLIYPKLGVTLRNFDLDESEKKIQSQLCLEILDKGGKPLECKFCDLEMIDWKTLHGNRYDSSLELFGDGIIKLHVKSVHRCSELVRYKSHLSNPILVRDFSDVPAKPSQENEGKFFADVVLEMLALELGDCKKPKTIPLFQLLLSFLYKEGCWAFVSISNGNGYSHLGVLKPFMVSSALLFVGNDLKPANVNRNLKALDPEKGRLSLDLNQSRSSVDCQTSPSIKCSQNGNGKRKEKKKSTHLIKNLRWRDFYSAAFEHMKIELEDVYFDRYCNNSKKLKFLKCWKKQVMKTVLSGLVLPEKLQLQQDILIKKDDRLTQAHQEIEVATSSASAPIKENFLSESSKQLDEATIGNFSDTSEDFFHSLSSKIQQGLQSEIVDVCALAERLVSSTLSWLNQKHEARGTSDSQPNSGKSDSNNDCTLAQEINKLLLRNPKDLASKPKNNDASFEECSPGSTVVASKNIVREHELQIFFRMEILRSAIGCSISESMKQKFIRQICLLLEAIQCHMEGGFFGEWSLENYVGKIIKSRYCQSLGDVVHRIYEKLDLLLFAEENDLNHLYNSEDSNRSLREIPVSDEVGDNYGSNDQFSAEHKLFHEKNSAMPQVIKNEHICRLLKAQEKRERARKSASFSSWGPDLRRVCKTKKPKSNHLQMVSKRKYQSQEKNDKVCETPLGEKSSFRRGITKIGDEERLCSSVSKSLFKDMD